MAAVLVGGRGCAKASGLPVDRLVGATTRTTGRYKLQITNGRFVQTTVRGKPNNKPNNQVGTFVVQGPLGIMTVTDA